MEALGRGIERLSTLSVSEYVLLIGTFYGMKNDEFNCSKCLGSRPDVVDQAARKALLDHLRVTKGCFGGFNSGYTLDGIIKLTTCPGNLFSFEAKGWIELWWASRSGLYPNDGGMLDQPAKMMDAFGLLDRLEHEYQEDQKKAR